ncbi:MAG: protein tyrosine phosphatase [Rhodobacteraceae bacterium]|nr:protein tyrosine phosphatase [Paracoccaceae bacterium]MAY47007.1 protein tyrosine phosphatase [Paracoccaceae bacterium]
MGLGKRLKDWEGRIRAYYNSDLSTPENRRKSRIYTLWFDHEILRGIWTNFDQVAPGVYRSNNPTRARFQKMKDMGITTVLNLRGQTDAAHFLFEEEACRELGLTLVNARLLARDAAVRDDILDVIHKLKTLDKPFLMHCKSGADRAGFAAATYLMVVMGEPVEKARRMLSPRYLHFRNGKVGILDYTLDCYAARNAVSPIGFEDWIATEYDNRDILRRFQAGEAPA